MTPGKRARLEATALRVREHIIGMATGGGCFIGASLSCADILVYLYGSGDVAVSPERGEGDRDVQALYGTLAETGWIDRGRLVNHLSIEDHIYWHPNRAIPGVEFHSGSLGHLLSVGAGIALDMKLRGSPRGVIVILGDGELDEGSVWEALLVASAKKLNNLVLIVDRNEFQANIGTEHLTPLEPLPAKFESFGCEPVEIDGHSFDELEAAYRWILGRRSTRGGPSCLIARTVRGKGIPSIEARADRWFVNFSQAEVGMLIEELRTGTAGAFRADSEGMMVR
jgi:transketolase